jgi:hypothetical protein
MIYYLTATGNGCSPDATLPAGAVECTQAQYANAAAWMISGGAIIAAPAPTLTLAQQATAMLNAGMQIVSTGTPALNATFACDPATYQRVGGIVAAIAGGLGLPGGGATFLWPDTTGTPHSFSVVNFSAFAKAMMDFEYTLNAIIGSNSGTLPPQPVPIA